MATRIETKVATQELIDGLKGKLRKVDQYEARKIFGVEPNEGLQGSFEQSSKCWVSLLDGVPICAFGVVPSGNTGIPWMVGTPALDRVSLTLVKESRWRVLAMLGTFDRLENYIWTGNSRSLRWLRYCGFRFDEPVDGAMRFYYERSC